ncbi:hypothetical protein [Paraburkholderia sp. MM5477-R1]|uniref:hypothetical protein n=1 Tax=Paraburkholderia sp. MM5477-R1 TaxID=2991062 RepID=UPI003D1A9829
MGTPNASGATDTMSGASGSNTMGHSGSKSKKQMQKKGAVGSPASSSEMKKPTRGEFRQYAQHDGFRRLRGERDTDCSGDYSRASGG